MNRSDDRPGSARHTSAAILATFALVGAHFVAPMAWGGSNSIDLGQHGHSMGTAWQRTALENAPRASPAARAGLPAGTLLWTFATPLNAGGDSWTAERGRLTPGEGEARLHPDTSRRVILVSPPHLPEAARYAEEFVVGVPGDAGLQRVRVQARRDPRGGWITIADADGAALRETASGIAIKRNAGARSLPIERLRIELSFRTTNPRALTSIAAIPAPR